MLQRSWFFRNGIFYTILAFVLLLHLILLAIRIYKDVDLVEYVDPTKTSRPIKVKILSEDSVALKKQIVQSEDPSTNDKPTDSSYLSDKNRKFDRESVARNIDTFKSSGKGESKKESQKVSKKEDLSLSDLSAFGKGHHPLKAAAKELRAGIKSGDARKRGISSTNDYVENVPLGDLTYLNTVEYKYYGFYHRIRQKLEQFWGSSIQDKAKQMMKEGRRVASDDNLITALEVTLNEKGKVVGIIIKGSSGIKELDDAAVESFNAAGPFPNPPKGLLSNGIVKIEWGFVVQS